MRIVGILGVIIGFIIGIILLSFILCAMILDGRIDFNENKKKK